GPARGVTDTSVKLGVAATDPAALKALGVPSEGPASKDLYTAWVAAQNKRGGVQGRQVELAFRPFLPTGPAEAQAACVELSEDKKVFLAIGILTGDTPLCFTETHNTPYLGQWGQSAERDRRSKAPFVALEMADDRQRAAAVEALIDQKLLTGKKVALYWEAQDAAVTKNTVKPLLDAAGIEVVVQTPLDDYGKDQAAGDQALDTLVQKIRSSGADTILNTSNFSNLMIALQRADWLPGQVYATSAQALSPAVAKTTGIKPATMEKVTVAAPYIPTKDELAADPAVKTCVDEYNAGGVGEKFDMAAASREALSSVANSCAAFRLFVQATDAAGRDLNAASWQRGAESLSKLQLPGMPLASLAAGKHSAGDAVGVYRWDAAQNQMVPAGPPISATK
ncbi:ABC transporter substrate-binding protein, partial [Streptomyces sp. SID3343]|uniref:ABC transporter substrate-binding protein n=1 Tax=Streptomyces sp. SID3343 TaxID=2690260 RepID=UPI00136F0E17